MYRYISQLIGVKFEIIFDVPDPGPGTSRLMTSQTQSILKVERIKKTQVNVMNKPGTVMANGCPAFFEPEMLICKPFRF